MKIICVDANYATPDAGALHAGGAPSPQPVIFLKPDSALLRDGKPFFLPDYSSRIEYAASLVVRISRLGRYIEPRFAYRYYDAVTVGIDFTATDLQHAFQQSGKPWDLSKGFDSSAVVGDFCPLSQLPAIGQMHFRLEVDGQTVQRGCTSDLIYGVDDIIAYVSQFYTLKMGDLIYTGTPMGAGLAQIGQHLVGYAEGHKLLDFYVR